MSAFFAGDPVSGETGTGNGGPGAGASVVPPSWRHLGSAPRPADAEDVPSAGEALPEGEEMPPGWRHHREADGRGVDTPEGVNVEGGKASSRDGGRPDPGSVVDLEPYRSRLQRFAVATFRVSREDAEDAAQETLIRARNVTFDGRDPFNFLARVLANVIITQRRRRRVPTVSLDAPMESGLGTYLDGLAGDDRDLRAAEARLLLNGLVLTLTPAQQRALALWEEAPNAAAVGRALGVSRQRAHRLLAEARAALRARLRGISSG